MGKVFFQEKFDLVEVEVTEQISKQNIKNFVKTTLQMKNIDFSKNKVFVKYISELSIYQIYLIKQEYKFFIFQIFKQLFLDKEDKININLYLCDNFFCIYKNSNFYYFKTINNDINKSQLLDFVKNKFNINNIEFIDNLKLEELKNDYINKKIKQNLVFLNINKTYEFFIYSIFLILLLFALFFLLNNNQEDGEDHFVDLNTKFLYELNIFKSFEEKLDFVLAHIDESNLNLKSLEFKSTNIKIVLCSNNKDKLYNFLKINDDKILYSSISFLDNKNIYQGMFDVRISK